MKKLLAILAIAGFLAACNNKADKKTEEDTTMNKVDTTMPKDTTPVVDTMPSMDTTKP